MTNDQNNNLNYKWNDITLLQNNYVSFSGSNVDENSEKRRIFI